MGGGEVARYVAKYGQPAFKAITVPTFVLHGEDDQLVPVADARKSIKLLKNGNLKLYAGAPHGMHTTHADVLDNDILALIQAK